MFSRRLFLAVIASTPWLSRTAHALGHRLRPLLSSWQNPDGSYSAGEVSHANNAQSLPGRAHAVLAIPHHEQEAIVVARRPGEYLARINWQTNQIRKLAPVSLDWRLMGHAVFGPDNLLYATEISAATGEGWISVRDPVSLDVLRRFNTGGIGPHELLFLQDGHLAVANGGILTLPETGRLKRNLDSMQPNLAILDSKTGTIVARHQLPDAFLSIRHLAEAEDGTLAMALQSERGDDQPILAMYRQGILSYAETPDETWSALRGYAASVSVYGNLFAITCTKGHCVALWQSTGHYAGRLPMMAPAGITASESGFWVSNESGEIRQLHAEERRWASIEHYPVRWDNHLTLCNQSPTGQAA